MRYLVIEQYWYGDVGRVIYGTDSVTDAFEAVDAAGTDNYDVVVFDRHTGAPVKL